MRARVVVVVLVVALVGVGANAELVPGGRLAPSRRGERRSSSDGPRVAAGSGISVRRPAGWHVITARLTSVVWPVQRVVLTSFKLRQARRDPGCGPEAAVRQLPSGGAFLFLWEYTHPTREILQQSPRRPARFRLDPRSDGPHECTTGLSYRIPFRDRGRAFQADVYLGARASARKRAVLLSVLDSLRVRPGPDRRLSPRIDVSLHGAPLQMISASGSVWVLSCTHDCSGPHSAGELVQVGGKSGQIVRRIPVDDPQAFAVSNGVIWVAHFWAGTVSRIDARTGRTMQTVWLALPKPVAHGDRRFLPDSISVGLGAVWVSTARGWLARIDGRSGRKVLMVGAPVDVTGQVVVGQHGTWVAESSLGVGVVRPRRRRLELRWLESGPASAIAAGQLAVGGGHLWVSGEISAGGTRNGGGVLTGEARIAVLDERSGRVTHELRLPPGAYTIAYGSGALFAANFRSGQLVRIDAKYRVHRLGPVRGFGTLIAAMPGAIWATTRSGRLRRIAVQIVNLTHRTRGARRASAAQKRWRGGCT